MDYREDLHLESPGNSPTYDRSMGGQTPDPLEYRKSEDIQAALDHRFHGSQEDITKVSEASKHLRYITCSLPTFIVEKALIASPSLVNLYDCDFVALLILARFSWCFLGFLRCLIVLVAFSCSRCL